MQTLCGKLLEIFAICLCRTVLEYRHTGRPSYDELIQER